MGSAIWSFSMGMQAFSVDYTSKWFFLSMGLFGGALGSNWILAFVNDYVADRSRRTRTVQYLYFVEPFLLLFFAITNPLHNLIWEKIEFGNSNSNLSFSVNHGYLFVLHVFYVFSIYALSVYKLCRVIPGAHKIYKVQVVLILFSISFPLLVIPFYAFGLMETRSLFYLRLCLHFFSAILMFAALKKYRLLDVLPAARKSLYRAQKDAFVIFNNNLQIVDANHDAMALLGGEIVGKDGELILSGWPILQQLIRDKVNCEKEFDYFKDQENPLRFEVRYWSVMEDERLVGSIMTIRDITPRWKLQQELVDAKLEADSSNKAKSTFLANMSHEIRTPLGVITGYSDILMAMEEEGSEKWSIIRQLKVNSSHLMQVIDDILDLSKIEAGKMDLSLISCSPWQLVLEAHESLQVKAKEKGIHVHVNSVGLLPCQALIDPTRVRQILINLLSNAIKFTEARGRVFVEISARTEPNIRDRADLIFRVKDEGIGMTEPQLRELFKPFQQADSTTSRRFGGTGLGLSIIHKLIQIMDGKIEVESSPGNGTTFITSIPCRLSFPNQTWIDPQIQPSVAQLKSDSKTLAALKAEGKLLLAEDNPDNQKIILFHLKNSGLKIEVANNGLEAKQKALADSFDLILMDMQMPLCDGYAATAHLRQAGYSAPIIALTANAMKHDREKCISAGCSEYLSKPISPDLLIKTIKKYLIQNKSDTSSRKENQNNDLLLVNEPENDFLDSISGDPEFLQIVDEFVSRLPSRSEDLMHSIREGNIGRVKTISHQLKGSAKMYGFPEISDLAHEIENSINKEDSIIRLNNLVKELSNLLLSIFEKHNSEKMVFVRAS